MLSQVAVLEGHKDRVWHTSWHPSVQLLASCGGDGTLRMWAPSTTAASPADAAAELPAEWDCVAVLDMGSRTVRCCEWSPCGRFIAACSFDSKTTIWRKFFNESNGKVAFEAVATLEGHENEVKAVAWNAAGTLLASCSRDKNVWLWEAAVDTKPAAAGDVGDDDFECLSLLCGHSQDVKNVVWNPTCDEVFSCSYDDTIKVWREEAGDDWFCVDTLSGHASTVWGLSFEATGKRFASCSDDTTVAVWGSDGKKWSQHCVLSGYHTDTVFAVDWSSSGLLASGAADDSIRVFQELPPRADDPSAPPASFEQVFVAAAAHSGDVNHVRWHPRQPTVLASSGDDCCVRLWRWHEAAAATGAGGGGGGGSGAGGGGAAGAAVPPVAT